MWDVGRAVSRQKFCITALLPLTIILIAAQFTNFSLLDQMNQLLDSRADYYGSPLPHVTIAHITHGSQSVTVLILGS